MLCLIFVLFPSAPSCANDQRLCYYIDAALDEKELLLSAHQLVLVSNWAKEPLNRLYFHLFPNEFAAVKGTELRRLSAGLDAFEDPLAAFPPKGKGGYIEIQSVLVDGQVAEYVVRGTWMAVLLPQVFPPGDQLGVEITFSTKIPCFNSYFGYWKGIYTMVLWYPQLAFLTSQGWLYEEGVDLQESLANFADYRVRLRLPARLVVAATGCLEGSRQEQGEVSVQTWSAGHVRCFGWVASASFMLITSSVQGVLVSSYFLPQHQKQGLVAGTYARRALVFYGNRLGSYPREQYAVVETHLTLAGLSLPGLCLISSSLYALSGISDLLEATIAHEVAHQWWGEKVDARELWFCEGFARFWESAYMRAHHFGNGWLIKGLFLGQPISYLPLSWPSRSLYLNLARLEMEDRCTLVAGQFRESLSYQGAVYAKAPLVLKMLSHIMGDEAFLILCRRLLDLPDHTVVTTALLMDLAGEVVGRDMSWFFQQWLESTHRCDYAISKMSCRQVGDGYITSLHLNKRGNAVMPLEVTLGLRDGSRLRRNWDGKSEKHEVLLFSASPARWASLDPGNRVLDFRPFNNYYPRKMPVKISLWPLPNVTPEIRNWHISPLLRISSKRDEQVGISFNMGDMILMWAPFWFQREQGLRGEVRRRCRRAEWFWQVGYSRRVRLLGSRSMVGARCSWAEREVKVEGTVRLIKSPYLCRTPYKILKLQGRCRKKWAGEIDLSLRLEFLVDRRRTVFFPTFGDLYLLTLEKGIGPLEKGLSYNLFSLEIWHHDLLFGKLRSALRFFGGVLVGSSDQERKFQIRRDAKLVGVWGDSKRGDGCLAIGQELNWPLGGCLSIGTFGKSGFVRQRGGYTEMVCQMGIGLRFMGNSPLAIQIDLPTATRDVGEKGGSWQLGWSLKMGSGPRGI
jgi:hypothetical protein